MFFLVINHFQSALNEPHLLASTLLSAALAVRSPEVATVLVVDGSAVRNTDLEQRLTGMSARYLHEGRRLSFSEGYNTGLRESDQPWTILCASDVYPSAGIFAELAAFCARTPLNRIGCLIPRLSFSDLPIQMDRVRLRRPLPVPLMTLNFNVFSTDYLRTIGGVPDEFSGNYNDVLLAARIAADGRTMFLMPGRCVHYGSLTLGSGTSDVSLRRDVDRLAAAYPDMHDAYGYWYLRLHRFVRRPFARRILALVEAILPQSQRHRAERVLRYMTYARIIG